MIRFRACNPASPRRYFKEIILNTFTIRNTTFGIFSLICLLAFSGCSQKPSSEEIAAAVKAALEAEKTKEQAAAATAQEITLQVKAAMAEEKAKEQATPKPVTKPKQVAQEKLVQAAPAHKIACSNCGMVVSVNEIELEGKGSGLGAVAGGVAGGLVGNQVGDGSGQKIATVVGLVGGAIAGNKIEKTVKKTKVYDVTVRMDSGGERVLRHETAPGVVAGDKIKVENEHVVKQ